MADHTAWFSLNPTYAKKDDDPFGSSSGGREKRSSFTQMRTIESQKEANSETSSFANPSAQTIGAMEREVFGSQLQGIDALLRL
eukprot:8021126-Pyramimonas_sp.AAC.1